MKMNPIRLVVGPLQTNCYIVALSSGVVVVDPADEASRILRACEQVGPVRAILLTHGHPDHVAAAPSIAEKTGAAIYAHSADAEWLNGKLDIWGVRNEPIEFVPVGELSSAIAEIQVIHTPGHTPGSVCYLVGKMAYVGDTLFAQSVGRTDLPGGSYEQLMASLRLLASRLEKDTDIFPGHGPPTTMAAELATNPWLQEALA